jgi:hypothetical protein
MSIPTATIYKIIKWVPTVAIIPFFNAKGNREVCLLMVLGLDCPEN